MTGEEEADRVILSLQLLRRQPRRRVGQRNVRRLRGSTKHVVLPHGLVRPPLGGMTENIIDGGKRTRAVWLQHVESARIHKALHRALVQRLGVDACGEVGKACERLVAAGIDNGLDRVHADTLDGRKRIEDAPILHCKLAAGVVYRGRDDLDAEPLRVLTELCQLVGIAHVQRHRSREELGRVIRLHIGGLVRDQRIGGRMALVEAVIGELGEQIEDLRRLGLRHPPLDRAIDEALALLVHLGADLLAHGAAQEIGFAQRVARQRLGDLHHLFLVDDDAVGFLEAALQGGMRVDRLFLPVLNGAIDRDVRHRARPVQRNERDDVFQPVRLHVDQRPAHARAFHLEHADRLATGEHGVGFCVVERNSGEIQLDAALRHQPHGCLQYSQGLEAEEVELHQPRLLHPLHVVLGDRHIGARVSVERHKLRQRPVADHDTRRMGRGVAVEPLQTRGNVKGTLYDRIGLALRLQARLVVDRLLQCDRISRILRHQLAQLVDLAVRHLQHAPNVPQHAACLQRTEGDDLGDLIAPVALLDVANDLVTPLLTEVDVEVGHRHAFGIEEALEQQAETQRIKVGDGQGIGDQRARARATARPDRNPLRLGPFDEVRHDQEVAGEFHLLDDGQLEGEAVLIVLLGQTMCRPVHGKTLAQPLLCLHAQFLGFVPLHGEARQDRLHRARAIGAASGNLDRIGQRLRQVGEQRRHLGARAEAVFGRQLAPVALCHEAALGDADQGIMRLIVVLCSEEGLIGCHQWQFHLVGKIDERLLDIALLGDAVALNLDIKTVAEKRGERGEPLLGDFPAACGQYAVDRAGRPAGQRDEAAMKPLQPFEPDMGCAIGGGVEIGA